MISGIKFCFVLTFFIDVLGLDMVGTSDSLIDIISGTSADKLSIAFLEDRAILL